MWGASSGSFARASTVLATDQTLHHGDVEHARGLFLASTDQADLGVADRDKRAQAFLPLAHEVRTMNHDECGTEAASIARRSRVRASS